MTRRLPLAFLLLAACGGTPAAGTVAGAPMPGPGLEEAISAFARSRVMVLPAQSVRPDDALGWGKDAGDVRLLLSQVDSALERGVRSARLTPGWVTVGDMARTAQRNPVYVTAPAMIQGAEAVRTLERTPDGDIVEPVASQLRTYAGFNDARYALVPVELRFERGEFADAGRAVLHVGVLDLRASRLSYAGDVAGFDAGDAATAIQNLGRRLADLLASR